MTDQTIKGPSGHSIIWPNGAQACDGDYFSMGGVKFTFTSKPISETDILIGFDENETRANFEKTFKEWAKIHGGR